MVGILRNKQRDQGDNLLIPSALFNVTTKFRRRIKTMKRKFTVLITCLLLAALSLFAFSCAGQEQPSPAAEYTDLSAEEAKAKIDEGEVILVDVRTQEEYDEKHIDGAILIPNETITDTQPEQLPDKDAEILVYCKSGNRSSQAAEKLADMGYSNVHNILGGISEWPY
jgi:phage shock protein E